MLRTFVVSVIAVSCFSPVFADTEFQGSVPLDLVKALLGSTPFGEPTIYSDLSSAFPDIEFPDSMEIMGSIERGYGIAAVYSTALTADQIESALTRVFLAAGYIEFVVPGMTRRETGFVRASANIPRNYNRFCHDSNGFMSHSYTEKEQGGTVTISANPASDNRSCEDQLAEQQLAMSNMGGRQRGLQEYLPRMELPEPETRNFSPFFLGGGYSGSSTGIETSSSLNIDWDIEDVFSYFAEQIVDQEWVADSENIGTSSASGSWTRSPEPGLDLIGTLTILKSGDESFELKFQLISSGANNNSSLRVFGTN